MQVSQETGKMVWYSHLFKNFPQFVVIYTVQGFSLVNEAEGDVFMETSLYLSRNKPFTILILWFLRITHESNIEK